MFSRAITELKPWTENGMFDNISCQGFRDGYGDADHSITAVARALFSRRLREDESFEIKISNIPHDEIPENVEDAIDSIIRIATNGVGANDAENIIVVSQLRNMNAENIDKMLQAISADFLPKHPAWKKQEKASNFLSKEMKAAIFFNEDNKAALIVTEKLSMPKWHLLGSMIPACVPAIFKDNDLDKEEKDVLKSLALHGSTTFIAAMTKLEERYDIRERKILALVGGFERREREHQVNVVDNEITQLINQMEDLMRRYNECCERKDEANVRRAGLKYLAENSGESDELVKFFQANKCLDVTDVRGSRISFIVRTHYDNFNPDEYEHFRENNGFFEEMLPSAGVFHDQNNARKLLDALFLDGKLKLRMCALYHLDIRGEVSTTRGYDFPPNCESYIPNYHLNTHGCFGDYAAVITRYLRNADTIGAINACIASAKSVNIAESGATFNPMMREVLRSQKACFELPDGTFLTPAKALEWLNEQEGGSQDAVHSAE